MHDTITFDFEELPLIIADGFVAGLLDGSAEITFNEDGEWRINSIYLEGYRGRERKPVEVDTRSEIYFNILDQLERRKDQIAEAVCEALEDRGIRPRTDYAEHSTLHRAFQGA